ncbi:MAG: hypothetical protein LBT29_08035 [Flavobacteriaceae bacterium]|jgi:hypothetical protein|nr:hypothetical protein [Flavobacteriaceae bacterium]
MKNTFFDNNKNPFTVPQGYFERLEKNIVLRKDAQKSFQTPDSYFDKLENNIFSQTVDKKKGKTVPFFSYSKYWATAACLIFILTVSGFWVHDYSRKSYAAKEQNAVSTLNEVFVASNEETLLNNMQVLVNDGDSSEIPRQKTDFQEKNAGLVYSPKNQKANNTAVSISKQLPDDESASSDVIYNLYFASEKEDYSTEEEISFL